MLSSNLRTAAIEPGLNAIGQTYNGTTGPDTQTGTTHDDTFNYGQGGDDTLTGLQGDDLFRFGAAMTDLDSVNGGQGKDTLVLDGDYSTTPLVMGANTIRNIETIQVQNGHNYMVTVDDDNVKPGETLTFDATRLGKAHTAVFVATDDTDSSFICRGGDSDDTFILAGRDARIFGGAGGDDFGFYGSLDAEDVVNGGADDDGIMALYAESIDLTFKPTTLHRVEYLGLVDVAMAGNDLTFHIVMDDANVAAGAALIVTGETINSVLTLHFDGHAETDGHFDIFDAVGNDRLIGGAQEDRFTIDNGGDDTVNGGGGGDRVVATFVGLDPTQHSLTESDRLNGGAGFDTLELRGDFSAEFSFAANTIRSIEELVLDDGYSYVLSLNEANVAAGKTFVVDASDLSAGNTLHLFSGQQDSHMIITGGAGGDSLFGGDRTNHIDGGPGDDYLVGLFGADTLIGGAGHDTYDCGSVGQTTGPDYDTIIGFDANLDHIALPKAVTGVNARVSDGELRSNHFNADLQDAIGAHEMARHHAVVFAPDDGDLAGHVFLIVDDNGKAGYQAGHDFVLELQHAQHLAHLDKTVFEVAL